MLWPVGGAAATQWRPWKDFFSSGPTCRNVNTAVLRWSHVTSDNSSCRNETACHVGTRSTSNSPCAVPTKITDSPAACPTQDASKVQLTNWSSKERRNSIRTNEVKSINPTHSALGPLESVQGLSRRGQTVHYPEPQEPHRPSVAGPLIGSHIHTHTDGGYKSLVTSTTKQYQNFASTSSITSASTNTRTISGASTSNSIHMEE